MSKTAVITARIDEDLAQRVDKLAGSVDRSRAWIVGKAIERYIADELELDTAIRDGEAAIDRGDFLTQEQMLAWVRSLDRHAAAA